MKKYGIYLLYPPIADLRKEGLGRHLAYFLKASLKNQDSKFVIACASWMLPVLKQLLHDYNIDFSKFEIIVPGRIPLIIQFYYFISLIYKGLKKIKVEFTKIYIKILRKKLIVVIFIALNLALNIIYFIIKESYRLFKKYLKKLLLKFNPESKSLASTAQFFIIGLNNKISVLKRLPLARRIFHKCQYEEGVRLSNLINRRKDILAWYCPTVFWPTFNNIATSKLICVPDVMVNSFPLSFALQNLKLKRMLLNINHTITNGKYFITYSQDIKINTLIKDYNVPPDKIFVIPHGINKLDDFINIKHEYTKEATEHFCRSIFALALRLSVLSSPDQIGNLNPKNIKFIFYASQGRPHKNILLLLRVYEYLLRKRYISHKLILTAHPEAIQAFADFTRTYHLTNDVLWLHGLSSQQLAACYKLADLAVNPSLSEGGFPFTFTEALSVDTPVVMAGINVTEEIITDPKIQNATLFDPYDFHDIANKIEWALKNKETLLSLQKPLYEQLAQRGWLEVVNDYIAVLDKISNVETNV